jgi:AcrR family transcriptional regulator
MSRELVLSAALRLADDEGYDALTMRRLAQELGVEAMTLYYYVANKDEILTGIVDLVHAEIELPSPGDPWKPAIRRTAISAHEVMLRHGWASAQWLKVGLTPSRLAYMEAILACLRAGGFTSYQTHLAYHALESHIVGFTLWLAGMALPDDLTDLASQVLSEVPADEYPAFVEHLHEHLRPPRPTDVGAFEFALDLLLDGFERMRADADPPLIAGREVRGRGSTRSPRPR